MLLFFKNLKIWRFKVFTEQFQYSEYYEEPVVRFN